jgi:two-component system response regulator FixJ
MRSRVIGTQQQGLGAEPWALTFSLVPVADGLLYCFRIMSPSVCVAIVDDEVPVRTALGRLLRLAHYDVTLFPSGEAFLESLETQLPDCVVLDINMPGMSGLDVQRRLRSVAVSIPAIIITCGEDASLAREALDAGAVDLFRKPFSNHDLLEAIHGALAGRD